MPRRTSCATRFGSRRNGSPNPPPPGMRMVRTSSHRLPTAQLASGLEQQLARLAVASAVASARWEVDAIIIGADAERRVVQCGDLHHLTEAAAKFAGTAGIGTIFLAPNQDRRQRFGHLDRDVTHAARKSRRG